MMKRPTRREAIKSTVAWGGLLILPSGLRANSPNSKICTAHIGIGGKGNTDTRSIGEHEHVEVIGLCDVDAKRGNLEEKLAQYSNATFYQDYREMLAELGDKVDAVSISTPDHTHYPATLAAMELGKHVYTQKPLTHKLSEARHLTELAKEKRLATQMGIQNQSSLAYRLTRQWVQDGLLGKISRVYVWSHKNWGYDGAPFPEEDPIPESLDWNLWLGTAPERAFVEKVFHPGKWRKYLDYGCGTLGDMGIHIFDTPVKSLGLRDPLWVEAECRQPNGFGFPEQNMMRYGFGPTPFTSDDFTFTWWDGAESPRHRNHPDLVLPEGEELPQQGAVFVGEAGRMVLPHCNAPKFYPRSILENAVKPDLGPVSHYTQWLDAIEGKGETTAGFDYAGPLAEMLCLGVVAGNFPGKRLEWDAKTMTVTNLEEANPLLHGDYRSF
ncbi:MAG: Gfo/Idh/MocA family oxidoreductase [Verrucomicrobiota bacterium]